LIETLGLDAVKKDRPAFVRSLVDAYFGLSLEGHGVSADMTEWAVAITLQASFKAAIDLLINSELKIMEGQTHGMYISRADLIRSEIFNFISAASQN